MVLINLLRKTATVSEHEVDHVVALTPLMTHTHIGACGLGYLGLSWLVLLLLSNRLEILVLRELLPLCWVLYCRT